MVILAKLTSGERFTQDVINLLHSTAFNSLDFHKFIQDFYCAEEYTYDYSYMIKKLNKIWQDKEMTWQVMHITFLEPISSRKQRLLWNKRLDDNLSNAK